MKHSRPSERDESGIQMYFVDLTDVIARASSLDEALKRTEGIWESLYDRMEDDETLWVLAPNDYCDGRLWPVAMAMADFAREESDLTLKNTITLHRWDDRGGDMESAYEEILFFVKDKRAYQFYKDRIRTAHVYEGHEWGGEREEGASAYHDTAVKRYNEDGKDPGNVWLNEDRTRTDDQSVDATASLSLQEAIRRCVLVGSSEGETVHVVGCDEVVVETITAEERSPEPLGITGLKGGVTN